MKHFCNRAFFSLYLFCASIIIPFSFIHDFPSSGRYNTHTCMHFFPLNTAVVYCERWYVLVFCFFLQFAKPWVVAEAWDDVERILLCNCAGRLVTLKKRIFSSPTFWNCNSCRCMHTSQHRDEASFCGRLGVMVYRHPSFKRIKCRVELLHGNYVAQKSYFTKISPSVCMIEFFFTENFALSCLKLH